MCDLVHGKSRACIVVLTDSSILVSGAHLEDGGRPVQGINHRRQHREQLAFATKDFAGFHKAIFQLAPTEEGQFASGRSVSVSFNSFIQESSASGWTLVQFFRNQRGTNMKRRYSLGV